MTPHSIKVFEGYGHFLAAAIFWSASIWNLSKSCHKKVSLVQIQVAKLLNRRQNSLICCLINFDYFIYPVSDNNPLQQKKTINDKIRRIEVTPSKSDAKGLPKPHRRSWKSSQSHANHVHNSPINTIPIIPPRGEKSRQLQFPRICHQKSQDWFSNQSQFDWVSLTLACRLVLVSNNSRNFRYFGSFSTKIQLSLLSLRRL